MLTSMPNPMGASSWVVGVGELAADFISVLHESIRQLKHEASVLHKTPAGVERTDKAQKIAADLAFLQGIVNASSMSLSSIWADVTIFTEG